VKLTGVVCGQFGKVTLLEIGLTKPILLEGEAVEGVKVVAIDEKAGRVTIEQAGDEQTTFHLDPGVASQTFNLNGASSSQLLEIFQEITGRTVLRSPTLAQARLNLKSGAALPPAEAEKLLADAFKEQGIFIVLRREKFAFAVASWEVTRLPDIPDPPAPAGNQTGQKEELFPPGLLKFNEADISQVLDIFQELTGRTVLKAGNLSHPKITVRSQTALSRAEAQWVLEAGVRLGDIALASREKFVFALPASRGAAVPEFDTNSALAPARERPLPAGGLKFSEATSRQVLEVYAQLLGRDAVLENVPACRFTLRSQTPLTHSEAVYALDAAAALNNVRFVVTDKEVRLVPAAQSRKNAATKYP
jgi:hypothetical protein